MSRPQPGQVRLEGLYEGPVGSWCPAEDRVADALRRAGLPDGCLRAVVEGGHASLEPAGGLYPRGQFAADPGEALALAVRLLLDEELGGSPAEWLSTLRVTEWREDEVRESLVQVGDDGVRVVARESPWQAPPRPTATAFLRRHFKLGLLLLIAALAYGAKEREALFQKWDQLRAALFGAESLVVPDGFAADAGAFAPWVNAASVEVTAGELVVRFEAGEAFPADAAALDALRAAAGIEARAALGALEAGRARLAVEVAEGLPLPLVEVDLFPLWRGEAAVARVAVSGLGAAHLVRAELRP